MPKLRNVPLGHGMRQKRSGKRLMCSLATLGTTQLAAWRTDINRRSRLERLPNELKLMITRNIPDVQSIFNLALTGPELCAFVTVNETRIARDMIKRAIPAEVLHVAVATSAAINSPWNIHESDLELGSIQALSSPYEVFVEQFVERYRCPEGFTISSRHPKGPALYEAARYLAIHSIVQHYAITLSRLAMAKIPKVLGFAPELSPTVLIRYEKALYVTQLVSELFSWKGGGRTMRMHKAWGRFWYALAPWETEQVYCVLQLLTNHFYHLLSQVLVQNTIGDINGYACLGKFINISGPIRLWGLERRASPLPAAMAFIEFRYWNPQGVIYWGHCAPGFGMRIHLDRIGKRLDQAANNPSLGYGDIDLGPMRHWYHIFLTRRLEKPSLPVRPRSFFSCVCCLVLSGYAFWDKIEESRLPMPPMDAVHNLAVNRCDALARNNSGQPTDRFGTTWFRLPAACTCHAGIVYRTRNGPQVAEEYCYSTAGQSIVDQIELQQ